MNKLMVVAAGLLAASFAIAQDVEIVKVKGRGIGTDKTEALKDAYRDAVERAVGLYVDAEQMMENEELVKDQILTQSNAYIEKYDVAKETTKPNGLVEIQILAEVRKTALTKKISDVMPSQTFQLNTAVTQNLHAKLVTEEKRTKDVAALLKNALEGIDPIRQLVKASLVSQEPKIVENGGLGSDDFVTLRYAFMFEIDQKRYAAEFLSHIQKTLGQVAMSSPKTIRFAAGGRRKKEGMKPYGPGYLNFVDFAGVFGGKIMRTPNGNGTFRKPKKVVIISEVGKSMNFAKGMVYEIDEDSGKELSAWENFIAFGDKNKSYGNSSVLIFNIIVAGKDGAEICVTPIRVGSCALKPIITQQFDASYDCYMMITPFVGGRAMTYYEWVDCKIPKDELPNVANITIELAE